MLERIRIAVTEVFGYTHLEINDAEDLKIDVKALVNENNWTMVKGSLIYSITIEKSKLQIGFGERPSNKELKKLAKDLKNAQTSEL